jgi:cell division protein FtsW
MRLSFTDRLRGLDPVILGLTVTLLVFGIVMLMSATNAVAFQRTGDSLYLVKRQLMLGVLPGTLLFMILAFIDYRAWKPLAILALLASYALLILVYIPGIGLEVGGSRSWIAIGGFRFQPSELVKLFFIIYLAAWFSERKPELLKNVKEGIFPFLALLGSVVGLLVFQPDTGSMAVIAGTSLFIFLVAGGPWPWFFGLIASGLGLVWILIKRSPYRAARFMAFLHPELDPQGVGYHINQAILAVASGGLMGVGFGKSRQKFLYLPEVEADSIFAVMGEELGFILIVAFLILFGILIWRCLLIARQSKDRFGALIATGIASWLAIQATLNIGSMIGLLPITGVTLPFISHGGTSLAVLLGAMGLVSGIPRHSKS